MGFDALFYIYLALTAAATTYGFVASNKAADAQEKSANAEALAEKYAAQNARDEAAEASRRERDNNRRKLARIHAGIAGTSGMAFEGSLEDVFAETAGRYELEVQDATRARLMEAQNHDSASSMAAWEGQVSSLATRTQAIGTAISGAASVAGGVYKGYQSGLFGKQSTTNTAQG